MFRAMLWKELREQGAILLALIVLGSGVIAAAATLGSATGLDAGLSDFRAYTNAGRLSVLALTIAAGVVVGGSLFAGEVENETMNCLELLPARRWTIWWYKITAGGFLAVSAGVLLLLVGASFGALGRTARVDWLVAAAILMSIAYGWGTFGSTFARTTLAACAIGLLCAVLFGVPIFVTALAIMRVLSRYFLREIPNGVLLAIPLLAVYAVATIPILLAGFIHSAPDRARYYWTPRHPTVPEAGVVNSDAPGRWQALFWLTRSQWYTAAGIGVALALGFGLLSLIEEVHLLAAWPLAASLAGVFGGVYAWTDEQSKGSFRFWGERRLPLTAFWCVKIGMSLLQTLFWVLLLFLPVLIRSLSGNSTRGPHLVQAFGPGILGDHLSDILRYMLIWPVYGFAFGHLAGMLFRKTIVALGVGLLTSMPVLALWLPSLLIGGLHSWQLWPVPLIILFSTRLLIRPWTADRIGTARPLGTLAAVGTACIAFTAFGLLWRAVEVPVTAEIDDDLTFAANVPQLDSEDGGRAFRSAVGIGFTRKLIEKPIQLAHGQPQLNAEPFAISRDYLSDLARNRWPGGELAQIGRWLESREIVETVQNLKKAATLPAGPIENPRVLYVNTVLRESLEIQPAVQMLMARGLWRQRQGDPTEFVECVNAALAIVRNARTQQPTLIQRFGMAAESAVFDAIDRWLERLGKRPDPIRMLLTVLQQHEKTCPRDGRDAQLADRMIDRNTLNAIPIWAPKELEIRLTGRFEPQTAHGPSVAKQKVEVETELASLAVVVPWERERFRRIMGVRNADHGSPENRRRVNTWFGWNLLGPRTTPLDEANLLSETNLNLALAQTALALFAIERRRPAKALDELVPDYLPVVPVDLFSMKTLRYRISSGEPIEIGRLPDQSNPTRDIDEMDPELIMEHRRSLAAFSGGLAYLLLPDDLLSLLLRHPPREKDLDFIGAVAGGIVQSDLEQWSPHHVMEIPPGGAAPTADGFKNAPHLVVQELLQAAGRYRDDPGIRLRRLKSGQGIVWSVGPDRTDRGGKSAVGSRRNGPANAGDLIRVVPFPGKS